MNAPVLTRPGSSPKRERLRHPTPHTAGVLVTGAAQRIGRAIAMDLAASGWPIAIHFNGSEQAAAELRDQILSGGGTAELLQADLSLEKHASHLVARAVERMGPIGVLINNASVFEWDDIDTLDGHSWARHIDLNLRAPLLLSQSFVETLPEDQGGVIINMADSRVLNPTSRHLTYTLSKTGLWTMTQTLAKALAPRVRVNAIGPGPTLAQHGQSDEQFRRRCARLPLQRPASLDEICRTVDFLISVKSITGQLIALDGGDHLAGQPVAQPTHFFGSSSISTSPLEPSPSLEHF